MTDELRRKIRMAICVGKMSGVEMRLEQALHEHIYDKMADAWMKAPAEYRPILEALYQHITGLPFNVFDRDARYEPKSDI